MKTFSFAILMRYQFAEDDDDDGAFVVGCTHYEDSPIQDKFSWNLCNIII